MKRLFQRFLDYIALNPNGDRLLIPICILVALLPCAILAKATYTEAQNSKKAKRYSSQCAEHKGIAVRDLAGDMRCVPTFFAIGVRHD